MAERRLTDAGRTFLDDFLSEPELWRFPDDLTDVLGDPITDFDEIGDTPNHRHVGKLERPNYSILIVSQAGPKYAPITRYRLLTHIAVHGPKTIRGERTSIMLRYATVDRMYASKNSTTMQREIKASKIFQIELHRSIVKEGKVFVLPYDPVRENRSKPYKAPPPKKPHDPWRNRPVHLGDYRAVGGQPHRPKDSRST
tara:strand:+ start:344 stop:937 length:594 start_codon:yes stop_codon:yes gene_type:complete